MKILVVDDHALVREGLRQVLKGLGSEVEVLEASSCARAFDLAGQHIDLDLILLDYHLPDMTGMDALDRFSRLHPELPIIVLSGSINAQLGQLTMDRGAAAFLTKSGKSDELLAVVRQVLAGGIYLPTTLPGQPVDKAPAQLQGAPLTPRQEEVLRLLMDGYTNKEIGRILDLSDETVKNHISAILRCFDVQTRTQAALVAERHGYRRPSAAGDAR